MGKRKIKRIFNVDVKSVIIEHNMIEDILLPITKEETEKLIKNIDIKKKEVLEYVRKKYNEKGRSGISIEDPKERIQLLLIDLKQHMEYVLLYIENCESDFCAKEKCDKELKDFHRLYLEHKNKDFGSFKKEERITELKLLLDEF